MLTIFSLIKIVLILTFYRSTVSNLILNKNFQPNVLYHGPGQYQPNQVSHWQVSQEVNLRGFYLSQWPSIQNLPFFARRIRLVMFMKTQKYYSQHGVNLQPGIYSVSADIAYQINLGYHDVHTTPVTVEIIFCQSVFLILVQKSIYPIQVQIGQINIRQPKTCSFVIKQQIISERNLYVHVSGVTVNLVQPSKRRHFQSDPQRGSGKKTKRLL